MPWDVAAAAELARTTLQDLQERMWQDLSFASQDYPGFRMFFSEGDMEFTDSHTFHENIRITNNSSYERVKAFAPKDNVKEADNYVVGKNTIRRARSNWSIEELELDLNKGPRQILPMLKGKRAGAMGDLVEGFDADMAGKPASSSDSVTFHGIQNFFVWSSTIPTDAAGFTDVFNGGNATGFTAGPMDIDRSNAAYARAKNACETYAAVTHADFADKLGRLIDLTRFTSPLPNDLQGDNKPHDPSGSPMWLLFPYDILRQMRTLQRLQNSDVGNDVDKYANTDPCRGLPAVYWPALDSKPGDPVYGIHRGKLKFKGVRGWTPKEADSRSPTSHTQLAYWLEIVGNLTCKDLRSAGFVLAKSDPSV